MRFYCLLPLLGFHLGQALFRKPSYGEFNTTTLYHSLKLLPQLHYSDSILQKRELPSQSIPTCGDNEFIIESTISKGKDGTVFKVIGKDNYKVNALKVALPYPSTMANLKNEIHIMSLIKDLGISPIILCTLNDQSGFAMTFVSGNSLSEVSKFYQENVPMDTQLRELLLQMLTILSKLHQLSFAHLDAHLDNWIWQPTTRLLKLVDFGRTRSIIDSPDLEKDDVLSVGGGIGRIFQEMKDLYAIKKRNTFTVGEEQESSRYDLYTSLSPGLLQLMKDMVLPDTKRRPSIGEALGRLRKI